MPKAIIRIDWFQVIVDLGRRGFTSHGIAASIGVGRTTLLGWKQGAEPRHADGERLVRFWFWATQRSRDELPKVSVSDWRSCHSATLASRNLSGTRPLHPPILDQPFPHDQEIAMLTPRKLAPQTPGEPIQEPVIAAPIGPEAEQKPPEAEHAPTADPVPVIDASPGQLPRADDIDTKAITKPVLTQQGYVVPEK